MMGNAASAPGEQRCVLLATLGFIETQRGPSGEMSYAIILNPYLVLRRLHDAKHPGLREDKYIALIDRALEIGADDLDLPDPWRQLTSKATV